MIARIRLAMIAALALASAHDALAQNPPQPPRTGAPPAGAAVQQGGRGRTGGGGGGGGGGRGVSLMTIHTPSWESGGVIPLKHSQVGTEVSPSLRWSDPPAGTRSFVLLMYDANVVSGPALEGALHWLVWNIPGTALGLTEGVPQGPQLPDGTRQISMSGPYYRGPAAPATGPPHHYMFELYAIDTVLTVEPVLPVNPFRESVATTRAAVMSAIAGRIRGKALLVGTFRRPE